VLCVSQCPGSALAVTHSVTREIVGNSGKPPTDEADNYWSMLSCCLTDRHRGQARSHRFCGVAQIARTPKILVGAGLPAMRPAQPTQEPQPHHKKAPPGSTPDGAFCDSESALTQHSSSYAYQSNAAPHPDRPRWRYRPTHRTQRSQSCAESGA
jgi:hypothetical protein